MRTAKEIMNRQVVTVTPETRVRDAADLMLRHRITGLPVVDKNARLLGVVSQTDLVRRSRAPEPEKVPAFYTEEGRVVLAPPLESDDEVPVGQIMTPAVFSADQDTPVPDLARFMLRRRIHRVVITRDGRLAGIVTSIDMMRVVASGEGSAGVHAFSRSKASVAKDRRKKPKRQKA